MKKGVTLLTVVLLIVVISILTASITLTSSVIISKVQKNEFVTEYISVQTELTSYYNLNGKYPVLSEVDLSVDNAYAAQFENEELLDGVYELAILDLETLNITGNIYGKNASTNDAYAVSIKTGIVYYLAGFEYGGNLYYRVTEDLSEDYTYSAYLKLNETLVYDVTFSPSATGYTNQPITVKVKLPIDCTVSSIDASNLIAVSAETTSSAYRIYTVNQNNIGANYTITVKYVDGRGASKEAVYIVDKYDDVLPTVSVGSITSEVLDNGNTQYYLQNVSISDNLSGIDYVKYTNNIVTEAEYFKKSGEYVSADVTILSLGQLSTYTIYVVDKAGNYKLLSKQ